MSLRDRFDATAVRAGVIVSLNGLSLWFLSVLVDVYAAEGSPPWRTVAGFARGLIDHTRGWTMDPELSILEATGYLGLALFLVGPLVALLWPVVTGRIH